MGTANRPLIEKASAAKDIAADDQENPGKGCQRLVCWNGTPFSETQTRGTAR